MNIRPVSYTHLDVYKRQHSDNTESDKQESVRNESWFKTKWENDPTRCV